MTVNPDFKGTPLLMFNISVRKQVRDIVTEECQKETVCDLWNGAISNGLE